MIDPRELRIGNLVFDSTMNTTKVETIIPEHNRVRHGIPLTAEWLERFGFLKTISWYILIGGDSIGNAESSFEISNLETGVWTTYFRNFNHSAMTDDYVQMVKIEYVHQLQNLYFSLTGQELTLIK